MNGKIKVGTYGLGLLLIVVAAMFLFFRFAKIGNHIAVTQKNDDAVENVQPSIAAPVSNAKSEPTGVIPQALPIFMYHYIRRYSDPHDPIGVNLSVSPETFEEQLVWLQENGYQTVFPNIFENLKALSFKPIILTFDDGYQDAYDSAFPLLQKYHMAGMFYLIVNRIGTAGYLTWDEIIEMQNAGMMFGSHTLSHPDLRNISQANLENEIKQSKLILEQKLGHSVNDFCYPSGKYNDEILMELKADGYQTAVTTASGIVNMKDDPFLLKRLRIMEHTDIQGLLAK